MRKPPLSEHIIGLADYSLLPVAMQQANTPYAIMLLQQASVLQVARKLGLRPKKSGKDVYNMEVNFMGNVLIGVVYLRTNHWEIEPDGDAISSTLFRFVFGPIELASIGLRQDLHHIGEGAEFIWKHFPHYRA